MSEPTPTTASAASQTHGGMWIIVGVLVLIAALGAAYFGGYLPAIGTTHAYFAVAEGDTTTITALDTATGHSVPFTELSSFAPMAPKVTVSGNTVAYLSYNISESGMVSCSMYRLVAGSTTPETLGTIPECDGAHGPNYSLGKLTNNTLELFSSSGEAGFGSYTLYSLDITTGNIIEKGTVNFDPRCEEGDFYDAAACTPAAVEGNTAYQAFLDMHRLPGSQSAEFVCGGARITRDATDPYSYTVVTPEGAQTLTNTSYVGCSN